MTSNGGGSKSALTALIRQQQQHASQQQPHRSNTVKLPDELWLKILQLLKFRDLLQLTRLNRHIHRLTLDRQLWRRRCLLDFTGAQVQSEQQDRNNVSREKTHEDKEEGATAIDWLAVYRRLHMRYLFYKHDKTRTSFTYYNEINDSTTIPSNNSNWETINVPADEILDAAMLGRLLRGDFFIRRLPLDFSSSSSSSYSSSSLVPTSTNPSALIAPFLSANSRFNTVRLADLRQPRSFSDTALLLGNHHISSSSSPPTLVPQSSSPSSSSPSSAISGPSTAATAATAIDHNRRIIDNLINSPPHTASTIINPSPPRSSSSLHSSSTVQSSMLNNRRSLIVAIYEQRERQRSSVASLSLIIPPIPSPPTNGDLIIPSLTVPDRSMSNRRN
jgi:hypothetical protein